MNKLIVSIILVLCGLSCLGQTTSVTATITDSDSQTWNNGIWKATLYNPQYPNGPFYVDGTKLTNSQIQVFGSMNSSGVISTTLYDVVNHITPGGTYYQIQLCPQASSPCAPVVGASPTGSSINLSTTLSTGLKGPRFSATGANAFGYLDSEVSPTPLPGGAYFNVVSSINRIWNSSTWINGTGGGGSPSVGTQYAAQIAGSTTGTLADSGAKIAIDSQGNAMFLSTVPTYWPLTTGAYGNIFGPGSISNAFTGTGADGYSFKDVIFGYQAAQSAVTLSQSIVLGGAALQNWVSGYGGVEDGNHVVIGEEAGQSQKTGSEDIWIGLKAHNLGDGAVSSIGIGVHQSFTGAETLSTDIGTGITNGWVNTAANSTTFLGGTGNTNVGAQIFFGDSNLAPSTTYNGNFQSVFGFEAGGCWLGTTSNLLLGSFVGNSAVGVNGSPVCPGTLPTAEYNILLQPGPDTGDTAANVGGTFTTAAHNIVIGSFSPISPYGTSGGDITSASYVTIVGVGAGANDVTANYLTAVGEDAANAATVNMTAVGSFAGDTVTNGTGNTSVGNYSCKNLTTGSNNVCVGDNNTLNIASAASAVVVGQGTTAGTYSTIIGQDITDAGLANQIIGQSNTIANSAGEYDNIFGFASAVTGASLNSNVIGHLGTVSVSNASLINDSGSAVTNATSHTFQYDTLPIASLATFSVSGCGTAGSLTGSGLAGTFTAGATSCTPVITTGVTAPHGFVCDMHDWTTPLDTLSQASSNATTATFGTATVVSADIIAFKCSTY